MTDKERADPANGIWLCRECASVIDRDEARYPVELLRNWKEEHEDWVEAGRPVKEPREPVLAESAWTAALEELISRAPIEDDDSRGWFHLFARPVLLEEGLLGKIDVKTGNAIWRELLLEAQTAGEALSGYVPTFSLTLSEPTVSGYTLFLENRRSHRWKRRSDQVLDLLVADDGSLELHCGRAGRPIYGRFVVTESIVEGVSLKFLAFAGAFYRRVRYFGQIDLGIAVSGIQGAQPQSVSDWPSWIGFEDDRYTRTNRVQSPALTSDPREVGRFLLTPFFRGLTHHRYEPFAESAS